MRPLRLRIRAAVAYSNSRMNCRQRGADCPCYPRNMMAEAESEVGQNQRSGRIAKCPRFAASTRVVKEPTAHRGRADMAHPQSLVPGNCYFHVGFYDNHLLFPGISTLEYVGEGADEAGVGLWLFREPRSVDDSSDPNGSSAEDSLVGFSAEKLNQILDFAGLSAVLA